MATVLTERPDPDPGSAPAPVPGRAPAPPRLRRGRAAGTVLLALVAGTLVLGALPEGRGPGLATIATRPAPASAAAPTAGPTEPATPPATAAPLLPTTPGLAAVVDRVPTTDRVVFLGIDDGLVRDPTVLAFLRRNAMPFTAFLTEGAAQADPEFWRAAERAGGTIQAHTIDHPRLSRVYGSVLTDQICRPAETFTTLFGSRPTLFRPPYGVYDDRVRSVAAECGYRAIVMWKGALNDGVLQLQEAALQPGDILLLHWRASLPADLRALRDAVRAGGFEVGRLEDYLAPEDVPQSGATRA